MTPSASIRFTFNTVQAYCALAVLFLVSSATADEITHGFLACGQKTYIVDGTGKKVWTYPNSTRDGYVLSNGNILLAVNKSKLYPGGAAIEVTRDGQETLIWKGTQSEVNSVQPTAEDTYVLTEAGPNPRLLEVNRSGKILVEFPLQCQKKNHHMETRMARKLADGTYLAPHLLDFAVKHYDRDGKVLGVFDTTVPGDPDHKIHSWPFQQSGIKRTERSSIVRTETALLSLTTKAKSSGN